MRFTAAPFLSVWLKLFTGAFVLFGQDPGPGGDQSCYLRLVNALEYICTPCFEFALVFLFSTTDIFCSLPTAGACVEQEVNADTRLVDFCRGC
jgi:hypothetical protein